MYVFTCWPESSRRVVTALWLHWLLVIARSLAIRGSVPIALTEIIALYSNNDIDNKRLTEGIRLLTLIVVSITKQALY